MKLFAARILFRLLAWLPLPAIRALAVLAGHLVAWWPVAPFKRTKQRILDHLRLAFPDQDEADLQRLMRQNLIEMISTALENGPLWYRSREWLEQRVALEGWQHVEQAQASDRGVLMLSGHLGNWETCAMYLTLKLPMVYLYKAPRSKKVDRLLTERRARFGGEFIPAGSPAMRNILRTLNNGGTVGVMFDQLPKAGDSVRAPFFNQPVETMTLVHQLAKRTGCQVLIGDCIRLPNSKGWKITMKPMDQAFGQLSPAQAATELNAALEQRIRAAPEQYLWQYRRFELLKADSEA